ncbi:MAG: DUF4743 domain-containing protein [Alphaproteobacteria bacterium]
MSLLDRINAAQVADRARYQPFRIAREPVGWIDRALSETLFQYDALSMGSDGVTLDPTLGSFLARSGALADIVADMHQAGHITGWRDEPYGIPVRLGAEPLARIERAAATVFGTITRGVHLNGYVEDGDGLRLWVARRASTKQTYPGRADVLTAGAVPYGESPAETLPREADEEAGIARALIAQARPAGVITACVESPAGLERGIEYCFDLRLPAGFTPHNRDGEVQGFDLLPATHVLAMLRQGDAFKPNCAVVVIDFLIRHGVIGPDEPDYLSVIAGLRRWDLVGGPPREDD